MQCGQKKCCASTRWGPPSSLVTTDLSKGHIYHGGRLQKSQARCPLLDQPGLPARQGKRLAKQRPGPAAARRCPLAHLQAGGDPVVRQNAAETDSGICGCREGKHYCDRQRSCVRPSVLTAACDLQRVTSFCQHRQHMINTPNPSYLLYQSNSQQLHAHTGPADGNSALPPELSTPHVHAQCSAGPQICGLSNTTGFGESSQQRNY